jgi:hypothetical protein
VSIATTLPGNSMLLLSYQVAQVLVETNYHNTIGISQLLIMIIKWQVLISRDSANRMPLEYI